MSTEARRAVYLDYAATAPVDPRVVEVMLRHLGPDTTFANPASKHAPGRAARAAVERAREEVAALVNCTPREIIWTSGATESDNLAIKGAARFHAERGRHVVTSKIEHKAVLDSCKRLEREGFEVTYIKPGVDGIVSAESVRAALRPDTVLVSIMHVNNELGTINDIAAIGAVVRHHGALFHVDAAQSAGKIPIDLATLEVDLMSFSAHKLYGPKGIGALYVRERPRALIEPLLHGGGHERGLRSGTLATHQVAGMGEAFRLARLEMAEESERLTRWRQALWRELEAIGGIELNGDPTRRVAGILNFSVRGVQGESLLAALDDLAVSAGSACNAAAPDPSYVLRALGRDDQLAAASLRLSLGRFTTEADVAYAARRIAEEVRRLRALSPLAA
ncbi:MAG TPA: IscS subfamily cysteine desulfurase [Gammaproteobacteria bacterium]|nr:IscS subfamily cysteine desulfurase [Gammaproteobacteria bacterium]